MAPGTHQGSHRRLSFPAARQVYRPAQAGECPDQTLLEPVLSGLHSL
jgi:hypothetical protein